MNFALSEREPNKGKRKSAITLSNAIITPDQKCDIPNLSIRILGIIASYAVQKRVIRKNASPTKTVLL